MIKKNIKNKIGSFAKLISLVYFDKYVTDNDIKTKILLVIKLFRHVISHIGIFKFLRLVSSKEGEFEFFDLVMSHKAEIEGANGWLEKSPKHFYRMKEILAHIPDSQCVYVIREPIATISSIKDRYYKYFDSAFVGQSDINYGIQLVNDSMFALSELSKQERNSLMPILFEEFCYNSNKTLELVRDKLGLVECKAYKDFKVSTNRERWKHGVQGEIKPQLSKHEFLLSDFEINLIKEKVNWTLYEQIKKNNTCL